jgi:hypothetical protein
MNIDRPLIADRYHRAPACGGIVDAGALSSTPVGHLNAMHLGSGRTGTTRYRTSTRAWLGMIFTASLLTAGFACNAPSASAQPVYIPVPMGQAGSFSVLSGAGVSSTGATDVGANLGAHTEISVVGFPPGVVHGNTHFGDNVSSAALADVTVAYENAASRPTDKPLLAGDLTGQTFTPGVHRSDAAIALTGTLTLDAGGDRDAVFVFRLGAALDLAASSNVELINGASSSNVFWQVVGATTIGASASMSGTILTSAAITIGAGATLTGRALSTAGLITLAANTIMTPPIITIAGGSVDTTDDATPTITGTTDAPTGTPLTVTFAGQTMNTNVADGGTWTVTAAAVPNGTYRVAATVIGAWGNTSTAHQTLAVGGVSPVALGQAGTFSVLGGATVTSTGGTILSAALGASGAGAVAAAPAVTVNGGTHFGDTTYSNALGDAMLAYSDAAGRSPLAYSVPGDLGGATFSPGVYHSAAAIGLTGTVTLDGGGDPDAVFVFQIGGTFGPAASSRVVLTGSASAANVFWQVVGATTIGASSVISGTILTTAAVTVGNSASLDGRVLSTSGDITLAANAITAAASAGTLSITTAPGVDLGTFARGTTISGQLGPVHVVDTRSGTSGAGWVASVSATAFTPPAGPAILATSIRYFVGPVAKVTHMSSSMNISTPADLSVTTPAVAAVGASGNNAAMATWNPIIAVDVPDSAVAGIYTSVVTYTVT